MFVLKTSLPPLPACGDLTPLGSAPLGFKGTIEDIDASECAETGLPAEEIERRLMEMGFIRGSSVEIKHEGFWKRDPIAVRINHTTVALRRREANAIRVLPSVAPSNNA
jgi:ferrous iron transport protein A